MSELHNMSVPSRSVVTVQREVLRGQRYRVAIGEMAGTDGHWRGDLGDPKFPWVDDAALTRCFRENGAACALAVLNLDGPPMKDSFHDAVARFRRDSSAMVTLRQQCDAALRRIGLPDGFGFFVDDATGPDPETLCGGASIAILAARSGPLYLPGRFEPSLITAGPITLFFPTLEKRRGAR
jgi:hypothetical protein